MTSILSKFQVGYLEDAKWVVIALYVLSTFGVFWGVYWEGDSFPKKKQRIGWKILLCSLSGEILFSVMIFAIDGRISGIQRSEIATLETRLAARTLSQAQISNIRDRLGRFTGQAFQIIPYWQDKESLAIANQIAASLTAAKWIIEQPKSFTALIGVVTGVVISVDKGSSKQVRQAAKALVTALNANKIDAWIGEENNNPTPTEKIYMSVGIKP